MFRDFDIPFLGMRQFSTGRPSAPPGAFFEMYKVFPASTWGKLDVDRGNKIIMPQSAAERLLQLNVSYPMMFLISNMELGLSTHCGVLEFSAEEGIVLLPFWMMQNLGLYEGSQVALSNKTLPKGRFVKIQPHKTEFIDLPNPKTVLENSLRNYASLTKGETIVVYFNQKNYELDILECRPQDAILTIETDLEVDFAPPKDYKEELVPLQKQTSITTKEEQKAIEKVQEKFPGQGARLDGKDITPKQQKEVIESVKEEVFDPRKHKLINGIKQEKKVAQKGSYWDNFGEGKKI